MLFAFNMQSLLDVDFGLRFYENWQWTSTYAHWSFIINAVYYFDLPRASAQVSASLLQLFENTCKICSRKTTPKGFYLRHQLFKKRSVIVPQYCVPKNGERGKMARP